MAQEGSHVSTLGTHGFIPDGHLDNIEILQNKLVHCAGTVAQQMQASFATKSLTI